MNLALNSRHTARPMSRLERVVLAMCAFGTPDGFAGRALSERSELRILHPECSSGTKGSLPSFVSRSFQCTPLCILCITNPLSYHTNTKRSSRNPFILIFLQKPGDCLIQAKGVCFFFAPKTNAIPSILFVFCLLQTLFTLLPPSKRRNSPGIKRIRTLRKTTEGVPLKPKVFLCLSHTGGTANRGCPLPQATSPPSRITNHGSRAALRSVAHYLLLRCVLISFREGTASAPREANQQWHRVPDTAAAAAPAPLPWSLSGC